MKHILVAKWALAVAAVGGLSGAAAAQGTAANAERGLTLVVLGSSTAAGAGAQPVSNGWVSHYETALRAKDPTIRVVNLGVGGYTTAHILPVGTPLAVGRPRPDVKHNITRALAYRPDAILINMPSNDAASGFSVEEQQKNFRLLSGIARRAGVPLWVATTQPRNLPADRRQWQVTMQEWIRATFTDHTLDFWSGLSTPDGGLAPAYDSGDGIHLNNAGHAILAERALAAGIPEAVRAGRR